MSYRLAAFVTHGGEPLTNTLSLPWAVAMSCASESCPRSHCHPGQRAARQHIVGERHSGYPLYPSAFPPSMPAITAPNGNNAFDRSRTKNRKDYCDRMINRCVQENSNKF